MTVSRGALGGTGLMNSIEQFFSKICSKNVYPVHKPSVDDCIIFNFGAFLCISNFVWRAFINESSHLCCKKSWSGIAQRNKYTC
jgi:hypothetical protein